MKSHISEAEINSVAIQIKSMLSFAKNPAAIEGRALAKAKLSKLWIKLNSYIGLPEANPEAVQYLKELKQAQSLMDQVADRALTEENPCEQLIKLMAKTQIEATQLKSSMPPVVSALIEQFGSEINREAAIEMTAAGESQELPVDFS